MCNWLFFYLTFPIDLCFLFFYSGDPSQVNAALLIIPRFLSPFYLEPHWVLMHFQFCSLWAFHFSLVLSCSGMTSSFLRKARLPEVNFFNSSLLEIWPLQLVFSASSSFSEKGFLLFLSGYLLHLYSILFSSLLLMATLLLLLPRHWIPFYTKGILLGLLSSTTPGTSSPPSYKLYIHIPASSSRDRQLSRER